MSKVDPMLALKQQAAAALAPLIDPWPPEFAAAVIGVERARIPDLRRGKLDRFSLERLIRFLTRAGAHVELRITPPERGLLVRQD
jgi:hypothetical protein